MSAPATGVDYPTTGSVPSGAGLGGGRVVGIGVDVVDIAGFTQQLAQPGTRFALGAFTAGERADAADEARRLATRFAAKEAFVKAWSSSRFARPLTRPDWDPREVEVVVDVHGRPAVRLSGTVARDVTGQLGSGWRAHLSLSHDGPVAAAFVVLESGDGAQR